jgi:hypothetical protein
MEGEDGAVRRSGRSAETKQANESAAAKRAVRQMELMLKKNEENRMRIAAAARGDVSVLLLA